jgi:predicted ATPase
VLSARIGLEAGPVVIDSTAEIFGDAPNIAARVQAVAEPGEVLVTAAVQRQIAGLFMVDERGSHRLKGIADDVPLFRVVRASGGGHRSGQRNPTPIVGRDEEIAMLMRRWDRARHGEGQLKLIVGEPGIGKSRLIEEFRIRLRDVPHTWTEWNCSQLLQNTPLHEIAEWGHQRFGGAEVQPERRLGELESSLAQLSLDPKENAALLAPLLDIPLSAERALPLPSEDLRHRQLAAMMNWILASARSQPMVLAVENLHWADPTTIALMRSIAERGALAPLFVLLTARPEFRPPWAARSHHGTISLLPLDRQQVKRIIRELAARHALAQEIVESVTERTGGVPLFVEEVTRLLLERGEQGGIQTIPPTLQESLTARLDRLGPAREIAQIGAVIGRSFSYMLVRQLAEMEEKHLRAVLEQLAEADILLVHGLPPESEYRFKHALIQDAAYESLLKSQRQMLHRRVGELLQQGIAPAEPELLAYHFTQGRLTNRAIEWWGKAAQRSLQRSALAEAVAKFTRALEQLTTLQPTPALRREEINLRVALINPLMHVKGYAAPETRAAAEQARSLIEQAEIEGDPVDDPLLLFSVLYSFWVANHVAFDGNKMCELATSFLDLAERRLATVPIMMAHRLVGVSLAATGNLIECRKHFDQSIALYVASEHRALTTRFGQDIRVSAQAYRSVSLWMLGHPDAAARDAGNAVRDAKELDQAATLLFALSLTGLTQLLCGNYEVFATQTDELIRLASEKDAILRRSQGVIQKGCLFALSGRASNAVELIGSAMSEFRSTGATYFTPLYLAHLATAHAGLGEFDAAWRSIEEARRQAETANERWWEAEIHRVAGEIILRTPEPDLAQAQSCFEEALTTARMQHARSWELRAATSMARLWLSQSRINEALELLAPIYSWFTEGFDTHDLKEAKKLLDELTPAFNSAPSPQKVANF